MQPPEEKDAPDLLGGRYRLGRMLGRGGMGAVFEARHVALDRPVAVKVLDRTLDDSDELEERFSREARSASRIDHPGIVDILDFGVNDAGQPYYVMELLRGQPLSELLAEAGPLPVAQVVEIGRQVSRAMAAAHRRQLVHRDLKPDNLMLVDDEDDGMQVKILDFGLARDLGPVNEEDRLTLPGTTLGTPEYMSPEQAMGLEADAQSDVYALGVVLYESLTGELPHAGHTSEERLSQKRLEPARTLDRADVPEALVTLVAQCLARDPEDRPARMAEVTKALDRIERADDERVEAVPTMDGPTSRRGDGAPRTAAADETERVDRSDDRGARPWVLLIVLAVLLLVAGLLLWQRHRQRPEEAKSASGATATAADAAVARGVPDAAAQPKRPVPDAAPTGAPDSQSKAPGMDRPRPRTGRPDASARLRPDARVSQRRVAMAMDPDMRPANGARARALLAAGNRHLASRLYGAARKAFADAAQIAGFRGAGLTGLAQVDYEQRRWAAAVSSSRRAVAAGGGNRARMYLGNSLYRLGRYPEAARVYRKVLTVSPGHVGARRMLGLAQKKGGSP